MPADFRKKQRGNKFRGVLRHDDTDLCPLLAKLAHKIYHFVNGNAARYSQYDLFPFQHNSISIIFYGYR